MRYTFITAVLLATAAMAVGCNGEDRSGEQPFAPTVATVSATPGGDSCVFAGQVLLSPNSVVSARGFRYGNDSIAKGVVSADSTDAFAAVADSLASGSYYVVAYATNGIGTSYGDTLTFTID